MGGAASSSKLQETLNSELAKPADGGDVDTPRGESAKAEVKRLRELLLQQDELEKLLSRAVLGDVPSLQVYLRGAFRKYDVDEDGSLSNEEFKKLAMNLDLSLRPEHLEKLYKLTDADGSGSVNVKEFIAGAPQLLQKLYLPEEDGQPSGEPAATESPAEVSNEPEAQVEGLDDWVRLHDPESECYYWYNKRTGESAWTPPAGALIAIAHEMEGKMDGEFRNYLRRVFEKADLNKSGTLPDQELWELVQGELNLGLSEQEYAGLLKQLDANQDGEVGWEEFVVSAPEFMKTLKENAHTDDCWISATKEDGGEYYYNAKTGETAATRPKTCAAPPDLPPPPEE